MRAALAAGPLLSGRLSTRAMMRPLALLAMLALAGCGNHPHTLGQSFPEQSIVSVAEAQRTNVEAAVVVRGAMTEKCPIAGCWFMLRDTAGTIKVDTKNAAFVVVDVPLHSTVTVAGRIATNGNERFIDATGLRF
jgi:uncharacterized protein YdeI (BOF family)